MSLVLPQEINSSRWFPESADPDERFPRVRNAEVRRLPSVRIVKCFCMQRQKYNLFFHFLFLVFLFSLPLRGSFLCVVQSGLQHAAAKIYIVFFIFCFSFFCFRCPFGAAFFGSFFDLRDLFVHLFFLLPKELSRESKSGFVQSGRSCLSLV